VRSRSRAAWLAAVLLVLTVRTTSAAPASNDPHYNRIGFFDIHVCHWPDRPMFYLMLFSTTRFTDITHIEVFAPNGQLLSPLNLNRYRVVLRKGKPEKRVFITNLDLPSKPATGWYRTVVTLKNGSTVEARDRVEIRAMPLATGLSPADGSENIPPPQELSWQPVPGARHYQVYVLDKWQGGKEIYKSRLLSVPRLTLPKGLLEQGGSYQWRVHARDVNEHIELGDFNHGSLSPIHRFTVAE